jgi:hypothetical protein
MGGAPGVLEVTGKPSIARYEALVELLQSVDFLAVARLAGRMRVMRSAEGMKALRLYVTSAAGPSVTECLARGFDESGDEAGNRMLVREFGESNKIPASRENAGNIS